MATWLSLSTHLYWNNDLQNADRLFSNWEKSKYWEEATLSDSSTTEYIDAWHRHVTIRVDAL